MLNSTIMKLIISVLLCMKQYHGGTNFGRTAGGPFITTSYDYDAPLDEYGDNKKSFSFIFLISSYCRAILLE